MIGAYRDRQQGGIASIVDSSSSSSSSGSSSSSLSFADTLFATAAAGAVASLVTSPLDLVKLRMQVQGMMIAQPHTATTTTTTAAAAAASTTAAASASAADLSHQYKRSASGFVRLFMDIYSNHGLRGIFRGAMTRVLFHTPNTAITLTAYDQIKKFMPPVSS